MSAKYLIRLDDICDTSNLEKWHSIEKILNEANIKPIVAVIPNNKDHTLNRKPPNEFFWDMIKQWKGNGWTIAMHGYEHLYHRVDSRKLILPFYNRSEFAGLSLNSQREKIRKSRAIFKANGVEPTIWVAPSHSFDDLTLQALFLEVPFRLVSDGIAIRPYHYKGFDFVPQQLWSLVAKSYGTWTVCLHPDTMTSEQIEEFRVSLMRPEILPNVIALNEIEFDGRGKSLLSRIYSSLFWMKYRLVNAMKKLIRWFDHNE